MTTVKETVYRGKKQRVGSPVFTSSGRLNYFMGYCESCHGKCMVTYDEARLLMRRFGKNQHRPGQRIALRILRKYSSY